MSDKKQWLELERNMFERLEKSMEKFMTCHEINNVQSSLSSALCVLQEAYMFCGAYKRNRYEELKKQIEEMN